MLVATQSYETLKTLFNDYKTLLTINKIFKNSTPTPLTRPIFRFPWEFELAGF